jgi:NADP-dependent 3-hydroxy acid dehydrogenase YdfG
MNIHKKRKEKSRAVNKNKKAACLYGTSWLQADTIVDIVKYTMQFPKNAGIGAITWMKNN